MDVGVDGCVEAWTDEQMGEWTDQKIRGWVYIGKEKELLV